ncbi:toll/interleukin-1 receptor domain-containing protein [Pseudomonas sp. BN515]|uniref:toll/interleukin-1 receptor domain-containing protein n=1 Tax=Pseudomonas sp. BN515 TaxID=2567892 RepID=UPI0024565F2B|nr:toll/interleukin-1 receptor domain-containing protein [Pseudomonas sp. BN515]MDH4874406.1 toll/interleukin-1 receptor domain-containing protein [Pseudomonas sp. BN515]
MALYELAVLGHPADAQIQELQRLVAEVQEQFGFDAVEIALHICPDSFRPNRRSCAAALFIGGAAGADVDITAVVDPKIVPVLPVVSTEKLVPVEVPPSLRAFNCIFLDQVPMERVFSALLECLGLLPRQRRVFLSYRRAESTAVAVQLFAELSARQFDVFLDTHSIGAGVDFQEQLWHQLSDVDVLLMLDTPEYFKSRWTDAEYGRALAKGIGVLRVQWPDSTPSPVTSTASRAELLAEEFLADGQLSNEAVQRICRQLEAVRSQSHALRTMSLIESVRNAIEQIEGQVNGVGPGRLMQVTLRNGRQLSVQPTLGVPTAVTLQETLLRAGHDDCAVVYNHYGMMKSWQEHLEWLAQRVGGSRWIRQSDAAWDFAGWDAT